MGGTIMDTKILGLCRQPAGISHTAIICKCDLRGRRKSGKRSFVGLILKADKRTQRICRGSSMHEEEMVVEILHQLLPGCKNLESIRANEKRHVCEVLKRELGVKLAQEEFENGSGFEGVAS